ncbi:MAG: cell wall hydrolase [Roseburia sp.]|nr:cell wall hydrolase [Roseburia sp.]
MRKNSKTLAVILAAILLVRGMPSVFDVLIAEATSTQQQIDKVNQERQELEGKLDDQQENIDDLKGEKKTLQGELSSLNNQLTAVSARLEELENQIREKEQEIVQTKEALTEAAATEKWQYECMVLRVQNMYERNDSSYVNALLSVGSFSDFLNVADWFEEIADYDQKKLAEFKETRQLVEETEARLESEKIELDNLKVAAEAEKSKVSGLISQTAGSIAEYAGEIEEAEQKAREYEAELKKKEEDLEYLKKKLQEELAMSKAAANATWRDISEVTFAEGDRRLLANLIYCEAGAEPYEGQLAVGSVVINRVLSSKYPDTVVGVIYQKSQFSPVGSGRLELALASDKATADCYRAADEAMSGVTNVGNCVYFRTPIDGLTGIQIGGHIFY